MNVISSSFESVLTLVAEFLCYSEMGNIILGVFVIAFLAGLFRYICYGK